MNMMILAISRAVSACTRSVNHLMPGGKLVNQSIRKPGVGDGIRSILHQGD
jgi:hypothetical protein